MPRRRRTTPYVLLAGLLLTASCGQATEPRTEPARWSYQATVVPSLGSDDLIGFVATADAAVLLLDPTTGQERLKLTSIRPGGAPARLDGLYLLGRTLVLQTSSNSGSGESLPLTWGVDISTRQQVFSVSGHPLRFQVLGITPSRVISVVGDTVLVGYERATGAERWRTTVPGLAGTVSCGLLRAVDTFDEQVLLTRVCATGATFVRVSGNGVATSIPTSRDAFASNSFVEYGVRTAVNDPLLVMTDRALTSLDPVTGGTRYQTRFRELVPAGYFARATSFHLSRNGEWLTARMLDSTGTAQFPVRDIVLRTRDGTRTRERTFAGETGLELLRGSCGPAGLVRVRNDLTLEYADVSSGEVSTVGPVGALGALRTRPITSGFITNPAVVMSTHIVVFDTQTQLLTGVRCAP
jgi:hypothetical protein